MKKTRFIISLVLLGVLGMGNAWAYHGGRAYIGVSVGPHWGPYYSPYPYYSPPYYPPYYPTYYPPVVVTPPAPPVYVQQAEPVIAAPVQAAPAAAAPINYWYYCTASKTYYPYVNECPAGWKKVPQHPPTP